MTTYHNEYYSPTLPQDLCATNLSNDYLILSVYRMMAVAGPLHILFGFLTIFCGVISFGYYAIQKCDPFRGGYITNPNQVSSIMLIASKNMA